MTSRTVAIVGDTEPYGAFDDNYTGTSIIIRNPYDCYMEETIELLRDLAKASFKFNIDNLSRIYSSIQDKPKLMPVVVQKQPNYNIRNKLSCSRTVKQGINYRN